MANNDGKGKQPARETIEMEDDDARLDRMQRVLEKLNTDGNDHPDLERVLGGGATTSGEGGDLDALLARVQAFLPAMEASNAVLAEKAAADPRSVDIENVDGDEEVVQMKLGLGVFEDRTGREDDESDEDDDDMETSSDSDTSSSSSSSSSDSDSSDSEYEHADDSSRPNHGRRLAPLPKRALLDRVIRPLPRSSRRGGGPPEIMVLSETSASSAS